VISFVEVGSVRAIPGLVALLIPVEEAVVVVPGPRVEDGRAINWNVPRRREWRRRFIVAG